MNQRLLLLASLLLLFIPAKAQLYLGVSGDFGNTLNVAGDGRVTSEFTGSLGAQAFFDKEIKTDLLIKGTVSGGFVNQQLIVPALGPFEVIPIQDLYHISSSLNFGKRFHLSNKLHLDLLGGGGISVYGGEPSGGQHGPGSASDAVFQFEMERIDNKPKGFAELQVQSQVHRVMTVGLRYQKHFSTVSVGSYVLAEPNQPNTGGTMRLIPGSLSLLVSFKVLSGKSRA